MRGQRILAALAPVLLAGLALGAPVTAAAGDGPSYYLALGDSLAAGFQPTLADPSGTLTDRGYVNDLYAALRLRDRGLQLENLGCPGETSTTMIEGSAGLNPYCPGYTGPLTSQLATALAFLKAHSGHVALVTIDIGANDVDRCFSTTETAAEIASCVEAALPAMATNLGEITGALAAADPGGRIVAMNYYDPFLADWLTGSAGETLAEGSAALADAVNSELAAVYGHFAIPVADVAGAFQTDNAHLIPFIRIPLNVALICAWTWMCAPTPYGAPNPAAIHANDLGYAVIAGTFITRLRESGLFR